MKMLIEIDKKDYEYAKDYMYGRCNMLAINNMSRILGAIADGTPLPKGHGRLIDADELYDGFIDGTEGYDCQTWNRIEIGDIVEDAPTIIEADRREE
jgi:hypothetical protein